MKRKVIGEVIFGVSAISILGAILLKKYSDKDYLRKKKIITKETEILNVYTSDFVISSVTFEDAVDINDGYISTVYTFRAKKDANFARILKNVNILQEAKKEYKQILEMALQLNKISPNATMVIHVASGVEAQKYIELKNNINNKLDLAIDIKINCEVSKKVL